MIISMAASYLINPLLPFLKAVTAVSLQISLQLPGITIADEGNAHLLRPDLVLALCQRLVQARIGVYLIKVIDAQVISQTLILYNVVSAENPSDILTDRDIHILFDDKDIDPQRLFAELALIFEDQVLRPVQAQSASPRKRADATAWGWPFPAVAVFPSIPPFCFI